MYGVFTLQKPGQQLHFVMHKDGLHYHDTRNREIILVQTVQENEDGYSQRQILDAKKGSRPLCKVQIPVSERLQKYHFQEPHFELSSDRKWCRLRWKHLWTRHSCFERENHQDEAESSGDRLFGHAQNILENNKKSLSALTLCLSIKFRSSQQSADILSSRLLKPFRKGQN